MNISHISQASACDICEIKSMTKKDQNGFQKYHHSKFAFFMVYRV